MLILLDRNIDPEITPLVSLDELKVALHINGTDDDDYLTHLRDTAIELVERETARSLIPSTWRETIHAFPGWQQVIPNVLFTSLPIGLAYARLYPRRWELQRGPVTAIHAIEYYDSSNVLQIMDLNADPSPIIFMSGFNMPGLVFPAATTQWPTTFPRPDAVSIEYDAGYTVQGVPAVARQAVMLLCGTWFSNRESEGEKTVELQAGLNRLLSHLDYRSYA